MSQLCCKYNKGEGDICLGNALGKCLSGLSPGSRDGLQPWWKMVTSEESDSNDYDEIVTTKEAETIDGFSFLSHTHAKMKTAYWGEGVNSDDSGFAYWRWILTPGLDSTECLYRVMQWHGQNVDCSSKEQHCISPDSEKEDPSGKSSHSYSDSWAPCADWLDMEASEKGHGHQTPKLTVTAMAGEIVWGVGPDWTGIMVTGVGAEAARSLLAKHHNIFSLEPSELGCTHSTKHVISKLKTTPHLKNRFWQIPPPLVEEVWTCICGKCWSQLHDLPQPECMV